MIIQLKSRHGLEIFS